MNIVFVDVKRRERERERERERIVRFIVSNDKVNYRKENFKYLST